MSLSITLIIFVWITLIQVLFADTEYPTISPTVETTYFPTVFKSSSPTSLPTTAAPTWSFRPTSLPTSPSPTPAPSSWSPTWSFKPSSIPSISLTPTITFKPSSMPSSFRPTKPTAIPTTYAPVPDNRATLSTVGSGSNAAIGVGVVVGVFAGCSLIYLAARDYLFTKK